MLPSVCMYCPGVHIWFLFSSRLTLTAQRLLTQTFPKRIDKVFERRLLFCFVHRPFDGQFLNSEENEKERSAFSCVLLAYSLSLSVQWSDLVFFFLFFFVFVEKHRHPHTLPHRTPGLSVWQAHLSLPSLFRSLFIPSVLSSCAAYRSLCVFFFSCHSHVSLAAAFPN